VLRFATRGRFDERAVEGLGALVADGTIRGRPSARSN
jgi:hypothetical protein